MSWGHYCAERFRLDAADLTAIRSAAPGETVRGALRTAAVAKAAQPLAKHGGAREQGVNNTLQRGSTNAEYLAARLKRDHPEIASDLEQGKFRSVRAAACTTFHSRNPIAGTAMR
jgi:hypothetical protein